MTTLAGAGNIVPLLGMKIATFGGILVVPSCAFSSARPGTMTDRTATHLQILHDIKPPLQDFELTMKRLFHTATASTELRSPRRVIITPQAPISRFIPNSWLPRNGTFSRTVGNSRLHALASQILKSRCATGTAGHLPCFLVPTVFLIAQHHSERIPMKRQLHFFPLVAVSLLVHIASSAAHTTLVIDKPMS